MPRKPSFEYSLHRGSGQAYVRVQGKAVYLGKYGTHESRVRHRNIVSSALAQRTALDAARPLSMGELCELFLKGVVTDYGAKSWKYGIAHLVAVAVCERFAGLEAAVFGPKALQEVQQAWLSKGKLCRGGVNRRTRFVVAMFKWAVSEELLPPASWQALLTVRPIRRGKGFDNPPREAADSAAVDTVIKHLAENGNEGAAHCVAFIRATGCRPGEAYRATPADFRLSDATPVYIAREHKNSHRGMERVIALNPAAVAAVRNALQDRTQTHGPLFVNRNGQQWEKSVLVNLLNRACDAVEVARWVPYQLRHLAATEAVNRTGNEAAAAAMLGHAPNSGMIQRYSRNRLELAALAAKAVGA